MSHRRYQLTIAYDGSDFHGWQQQHPPGQEPLRTVQGVLTDALQRIVGHPVRLQGASRTDAGVHAIGQVAHFDADTPIPVDRLPLAINSRVEPDVEVLSARVVPDGFDATSDAIQKQYRYRLWVSRRRPLVHRKQFYTCFSPLDVKRMRAAAQKLVGEHDFAAFAAAGHQRLSTVRTIFSLDVEEVPGPWPDVHQVHLVVRGNGFLYNMVRILAGTLVDVGRGLREPEHMDRLLQERTRQEAGQTLPPEGLCLEWVDYGTIPPVEEKPAASLFQAQNPLEEPDL